MLTSDVQYVTAVRWTLDNFWWGSPHILTCLYLTGRDNMSCTSRGDRKANFLKNSSFTLISCVLCLQSRFTIGTRAVDVFQVSLVVHMLLEPIIRSDRMPCMSSKIHIALSRVVSLEIGMHFLRRQTCCLTQWDHLWKYALHKSPDLNRFCGCRAWITFSD